MQKKVFKQQKLKDYKSIKEKYKINNYELVEINGKNIKNDLGLRDLFDKSLKLPSYCGPTMDSVHDCFYDPNWSKKRKFVLLIRDFKYIEDFEGLLRIFEDIFSHASRKKDSFIFQVVLFV